MHPLIEWTAAALIVIAAFFPGERQPEQCVEKREGEADEQADLRIRNIECGADWRDEQAQDHPVDE